MGARLLVGRTLLIEENVYYTFLELWNQKQSLRHQDMIDEQIRIDCVIYAAIVTVNHNDSTITGDNICVIYCLIWALFASSAVITANTVSKYTQSTVMWFLDGRTVHPRTVRPSKNHIKHKDAAVRFTSYDTPMLIVNISKRWSVGWIYSKDTSEWKWKIQDVDNN